VIDGLEVASRLAAEGIAIAGPRALREAAQRIADLVPRPLAQRALASDSSRSSLPPDSLRSSIAPRAIAPAGAVPAIAAPGREPRAIVWLDADRAGLTRAVGDRAVTTALVSARAAAGADSHDAGFAWAAAADRAQLLGWIEATGARDVFVTGAAAEAIVAALGARARVIGPPQQMSLFPHEAFP
jgi:hypothetical protein